MAAPTDVIGLLAWYSADQLGIGAGLLNGASVTSWTDLSPTGSTVSQTTASLQPTYGITVHNGLPTVAFNDVNGPYTMAAPIVDPGQALTIFVVVSLPNSNAASFIGSPGLFVGSTGTGVPLINAGTALSGGTPMASGVNIITAQFNGSSSLIRQGGTQVATGNAGTNALGRVLNLSSEALPLFGDMPELLVYSGVLTTAQMQDIESYLTAKYTGVLSVPTVTTQAVSTLSDTSTTLNGLVTANNQYTKYYFQWGTDTTYGNQTPAQYFSAGAGATAVNAPILGLSQAANYHYRLVAVNTKGTTFGADQPFMTNSTNLTQGVLASYAPWVDSGSSIYLTALGSMFETVYGIVADKGFPDDPHYVPGWASLLDPDNCPTQFLPFLAQFNGTSVPPNTSDVSARAIIKGETGMQRGTAAAMQQAAMRNLFGVSTQLAATTEELATITAPLSTNGMVTQIPISLTTTLSIAGQITLSSGSHSQVFIATSSTPSVINVVAQTPNFAYPTGSVITGPFMIFKERTGANGGVDPYHVVIGFNLIEAPSVPNLVAAVEAVKPAGIQVSYVTGPAPVSGFTWNEAINHWNQDSFPWISALNTQP